ncbi:MAG: T9SS type A sorting domain-containing protein [Saprospiraceae bacterium]
MKRTLFLLAFLVLLGMGFSLSAQRNCATMENLEYLQQLDPNTKNRLEAIERHTQRVLQGGARAVDGVITIPVVFHVVYNTPSENISAAQLQSQIDILNEDFRRINADIVNTPADFQGVAADVEIQFCLASTDPNGFATSGITRTPTTVAGHGTDNSVKFDAQGGKDAWPASDYLNFWVCNIGGSILGYAQFPGGPAATDGVVCDYRFVGNIGTATAPFDLGRTATHEVGHWLNLRHIWGDGGCGVDDLVADTPLAGDANYTGSPCTYPGPNTCNTGAGDLPDMFQNYMDYSDDGCMNLFTQGQKERMRALFEEGGDRVSLLSSPGCSQGEPASCTDGFQNGDETGVDCGGSNCVACPTCDDGIQNGNETGVDCGGPTCPVCPTCNDGIQNGEEEGVDCGGPDCVSCNGCFDQIDYSDFDTDMGIWNDGGADCRRSASDYIYAVGGTGSAVRLRDNSSSSNMTTNPLNLAAFQRVAIKFSYITESMDNADEDFWLQVSTDGGSTFTTVEEWNLGDEFENGVRYFETLEITGPFTASTLLRFQCDASDDGDYVYIDNVRITGCTGGGVDPTCDDGIQNGDETGVDCGGPDCPACPVEPTCDDGIQNGDETGVDCGGPDCPACPVEPTCDDGIQNGDETGVDCGGPDCPACPVEPTCEDGIQNGDETGVDCGGPDCPACPVDPTCDDGIQNGDETGVDCGGSCAPCDPGSCTTVLIDSNDFENGYGMWNDGGTDCRLVASDQAFANSGIYCVRLQDNTSSSVLTTNSLNLAAFEELTVSFSYIAESMDNSDEDFWLQVSTDGGATFVTVEEWNQGDEFENGERKFDSVVIPGPFSANTLLRFRCDASTDSDNVYIDDVTVSGCQYAARSKGVATDLNAETSIAQGLSNVYLFPNPTRGELTLSFNMVNSATVQLILTDLSGKVMRQEQVNLQEGQQRKELDTSLLSPGIYFVHLVTKEERVAKKFVVIK